VTSLDPTLQRVLEPRTTSPQDRLYAIEQLRAAKIPVGVMVAPIIPGLTDHEVPKILDACAKAGAQFAGYTIIRLPWAVAPLFEHWLEEHFPDRKEKVLRRIRHLRGDRLNNSQWHRRMTGEGVFAEQIAALFKVGCRRAGIGARPTLSWKWFRRSSTQLRLFA
jgi:DNA repair photolyase